MTFDEYRTFYPPLATKGKVLLVNNKECSLIDMNVNCSPLPEYPYASETTITLYLELVKVKSKEQLLAEETVTKAGQALEAAKKTLQQIKEK
jgi:hypothetical protein